MPCTVITVAQMREWENATWAAGLDEQTVIRRVGVIVAERARRFTQPGSLILILAGKGHNGEDVREAQPHFTDREVCVLNVADPTASLTEVSTLLARKPALIIDGLFGIGLNRPLAAEWIQLIERINQAQLPVLAVDVPSGLNAETGQAEGAAIRATITLTLGAPKSGMLRSEAWPFVGRLEVAPEIGLVPCPCRSELQFSLTADFAGYPPARPVAAHKGSFGHLAIIAGSLGYHGAAVLAAHGALRACPGLVTVFTPDNVYVPIASQLQAAMVHPWQPSREFTETYSAILIGPGLAARDLPDELKSEAGYLWTNAALPVIADASTLDWLPRGSCRANSLRIITPHPGEAARMLKTSTAKVQADRPAAVRALSLQYGHCWVVLKGHQTIVGRSAGEIFINGSGNPHLAQGGSGDVLAGFLAGLLAQPALQADSLTAIRYAVWQHGASADVLSAQRTNWTIADLVQNLGSRLP